MSTSIELNNNAASLMRQTYENNNLAVKCLHMALLALPKLQQSGTARSKFRVLSLRESSSVDVSTSFYSYTEASYDEGMMAFTQPLSIHPLCSDTRVAEATINFNIGLTHSRQQEDKEASLWYQKALQLLIKEKYQSSSIPLYTMKIMIQTHILNNIGHIHWRVGSYDVAASKYSEALDSLETGLLCLIHKQSRSIILDQKIKEIKLYTSATLNCLAVARFYSKDNEKFPANETLLLLKRALRIHGEATGYDAVTCPFRETATIMNNMGRIMFASEEFDDALIIYKETFRNREALLGADHLDVGITLYNIAETESSLGNSKGAIEAYKRFLTIAMNKLGPNHNDVISVLLNIGQLHLSMQDYIVSIDFLSRALKAAKRTLGANHETVAFILNQIGNATYGAGYMDAALKFYDAGLAIERTFEDCEEALTVTLSNIANIARLQGDYKLALKYYNEALALFCIMNQEEMENRHDEQIANILASIAFINEQQGEYPLAAERLRKSIEIRQKCFGKHNFSVSTALNSLGLVQFRQGAMKLALDSFIEALGIRFSNPKSTPQDISTVSNNVATAYERLGDLDKALYYYNETLNLDRKTVQMNGTCNPKNILCCFHKIASIYKIQQKYQCALKYYQEAAYFCEEHRDAFDAVDVLKVIAELHYAKECNLASLDVYSRGKTCAPAA